MSSLVSNLHLEEPCGYLALKSQTPENYWCKGVHCSPAQLTLRLHTVSGREKELFTGEVLKITLWHCKFKVYCLFFQNTLDK